MAAERSLSEIVEHIALSRADVAYLSGLQESTVGRVWDNPSWLDVMEGRSIQALMAVLPGIADYVAALPMQKRRGDVARRLGEVGLEPNGVHIKLLTKSGVSEQYIWNALETAVHIVSRTEEAAISHINRFWGRDQDLVLGHLFSKEHEQCLLLNNYTFLREARRLADLLASRSRRFQAMLAHATLVHHLARSTGESLRSSCVMTRSRQGAFLARSETMGLLIQSNDIDRAKSHAERVKDDKLLGMIEDWSMATYARDSLPTKDFSLHRSISLTRTAEELIREIGAYNDAYVYYLASTYLPIALKRDPRLGGRRGAVLQSLDQRLAMTQSLDAEKAIAQLLHSLNN